MIFTKKNIALIQQFTKSQTTRFEEPIVKPGRIYPIQTNWFRKADGRILIVSVGRKTLRNYDRDDIRREGCNSRAEFFAMLKRVNHGRRISRNMRPWKIRFRYLGR